MDDITAINAALVRAGCTRITSLEEDCVEAEVAGANYTERRQWVLSLHPWRFAQRQVVLSRSAIHTPDSVFDATYLVPECSRILGVRVNDCPITFDRYERDIYCNALETDLVVADLVMDQAVDYWPAYAVAVLIDELAGIFALAIAEDAEKAGLLSRSASRALTNAKTADSQGRTAAQMPVGGFRRFVAGGAR